VESLGFALGTLVEENRILLDSVRIERGEIEETGEYDLEGLFVRLGSAIAEVGAKRVALDGIDALFAALPSEAIVRAELRRLFRWLKDQGVTAVITGEQGEKTLTRHGLEEYVSDCVIFLDHRMSNQVATRRLRIVKYRGSRHGTNEYPTLIDEAGFSVLPISSLSLSRARVHRHPEAGRHARRQGILQRQQRPRLGHLRCGQEQHRNGLCRRYLPPGRTLSSVVLGGVTRPDPA
jgi:circadian clock protein KaiC